MGYLGSVSKEERYQTAKQLAKIRLMSKNKRRQTQPQKLRGRLLVECQIRSHQGRIQSKDFRSRSLTVCTTKYGNKFSSAWSMVLCPVGWQKRQMFFLQKDRNKGNIQRNYNFFSILYLTPIYLQNSMYRFDYSVIRKH